MKALEFLKKSAYGAVIGVAMIIPGVSGGTIAVLLNIYNDLIDAISNLRREFKKSFLYLLPIVLGAAAAVVLAYFPLKYFLDIAPFPTVLLFAGLMIGSCPKIVKDGIALGFKKTNILSLIIPFLAVVGICLIPHMGAVNLGADMAWWLYIVLVIMGMLASCALVIPGVSGSMLLLIFGFYTPILDTVSCLTTSFLHSATVLLLFAAGLIVGFFSIAKLMKYLMKKFPRGTNWAIIGFVAGSIPAILVSFPSNFPEFLPVPTVHIIVGVILCALGAVGAYALTAVVEAKINKQ